MQPEQKVIIYRAGMRKGSSQKSFERNHRSAEYAGRDKVCPRCGRMLKYLDRKHYSDPPNKIPCLPPR